MQYDPSLDVYNPKANTTTRTKGSVFAFKDLENPIALEIVDPSDISKTYKEYPIVPYAGTLDASNDGLLYFLNSMVDLSATLGACVKSIRTYSLGGKLGIEYVNDLDFIFEDEEIELEAGLSRRYVEFIKENITFRDGVTLSEVYRTNYKELKSNGNIWMEVICTNIGGVKKSYINHYKTKNCRFIINKDDPNNKYVAISKSWGYNYLRKYPPKVVPKYPLVEEVDGGFKTMIHVAEGSHDWYGRPDWLAAWLHCYREFQDVSYMTKLAGKDFVGQHLIEIEDDNVELDDIDNDTEAINGGHSNIVDKLEERMSANSDDPQRIIVMTRPHGAKEAFVYSFPAHTKEDFYKISSDLARQKIIENNEWSERLLGNSVVSGFAEDVFMSELKIKEVGVLEDIRTQLSSPINLALSLIEEFFEVTEFEKLAVKSLSIVDKMTKGKRNVKETKTLMDAIGTGFRSGTLTPTVELEEFVRNEIGVPAMTETVRAAWKKEEGEVRRPVSIVSEEEEPEVEENTEEEEIDNENEDQ